MVDRPTLTETVADLDGEKVLVIRADDDRIVAVQTATTVAQRIDNLGTIIAGMEENIAKPDAEHLAAAAKRLDDYIAKVQARKDALTVDGVGTAAKAAIAAKLAVMAGQVRTLRRNLATMGGDPRPAERASRELESAEQE